MKDIIKLLCKNKTVLNKLSLINLIIVILLSITLSYISSIKPALAQDPVSWVYLPLTLKSPSCNLNDEEVQIAFLMETDTEQQRPSLKCDPILASIARARAEDMATRHYFSHTNPDGHGPNYLVREAGYILPSYYGTEPDANNIESIAAGYSTPQTAWSNWMNSAPHREHLLGLNSFYEQQIEYGIGYVYDPNSDYQHYWVVIAAKPG